MVGHALAHEFALHGGDVHLAQDVAAGDGDGGCGAGALADAQADGHGAEI